ncbi:MULTISPECIES: LysR substrate-binding domain-containing protein [Rhodomicrobium]|uniref:LysR family transcriptional regulator n=1 Tax=Rhodomicrobium TaxID=1068 RepID=UPI000B4A84DF|nr:MULTISPECIES: LysR substrate-binding domain-containing protein [Rhodomicrobium]
MDRFDSMSILLSVVEAGSLSAAGRKLRMPLTTVSRKISDLEAHLKTRLLNRTSRQLTLTDAGLAYVAACKRILEDLGEAERAAMGEYSAPKGNLVVTAPVVFGRLHVLPVISEFLKSFPEIDIRLVLADRLVNILDDHIDLAIRIGRLPDSSLVAIRIGEIRRVICASPSYWAARGLPASPDELRTHDCIAFQGLTAPEAWRFGNGNAEMLVPLHSRLVVNTAEAAIDAAIGGVGVTRVLSYQIADAVRAGRLATALEAFEPAPWPISLVHAGQGLLPLKLRAFLDFAAPRLKERVTQAAL